MGSLDKDIVERLVIQAQKPGRYTGGELNSIVKKDVSFRMAISYPDLYDVGMANNGIRILYDVVNAMDDVACERVFAVAPDFEEILRENNTSLYTLETYTSLKELDLLGFNLSHELLTTNILQILDLGEIPLLASDRTEDDPFIVGGGEYVSNPMPLKNFFDIFFAGDGEEGLPDLVTSIKESKKSGMNRTQILDEVSKLEGVIVASNYKTIFDGKKVKSIEGKKVSRRVYKGSAPVDPIKPIVPNMRISQERAVVEVTRGCPNMCKFCHSGFYQLPFRQHDYVSMKDRVLQIIDNTGYDELTLSSLSISDYRSLGGLVNSLLPELNKRGVSISLPSLKVDKKTLPIIEQISNLRRASLTFAVESASIELREIANKKVYIDDLLEIVQYVFEKGWKVIKFYFMIGMPGCDEHDEAESIIDLLKKISYITKKRVNINVTVSPFIPKPHTPFERVEQKGLAYLDETVLKIKRGLPHSIRIKNHDGRLSVLEGVFARGDERLGEVFLAAYKKGCRLDSWREHFKHDIWIETLDEIIPDWLDYLNKREDDDLLPWSFISTGYDKAIEHWKDKNFDFSKPNFSPTEYDHELNVEEFDKSRELFEKKYEVVHKVRIHFEKLNSAKFIAHLDLMDVLKRAFRMSGISISFSQGFNKREKMSMGFPVPLGIQSSDELCDLDLFADVPENFIEDVNTHLPDGVNIFSLEYFEKSESIMGTTVAAEYSIEIKDLKLIEKIEKSISDKIVMNKKTKKGQIEVEFDKAILDYKIEEGGVILKLSLGNSNSIRIDNALMLLGGLNTEDIVVLNIVKTKQFREDGSLF